jgi:hypothetical protein
MQPLDIAGDEITALTHSETEKVGKVLRATQEKK